MNNNNAFLPEGLISPTSSSHELWPFFFHLLFLRFSTASSLLSLRHCTVTTPFDLGVLWNPLLHLTSRRSFLNSICTVLAVDWAGQCPGLFYLPLFYLPAAQCYQAGSEVQAGVCALPAVDAPLTFIKDAPGAQAPVVFPGWQKLLAKRLIDIKGSYPPGIKC